MNVFMRMACLSGVLTSSLMFADRLAAAEEYPFVNQMEERAQIPWLKKTERRTDQIWRTSYDDSLPERSYKGRIVSYAGKWTRHNFGGHAGLGRDCGWRYAFGPLSPKRANWKDIGELTTGALDIDGDGDISDDFIFSLIHSMEVPHSIPDWPMAHVFPERLSGVFYGGTTFYCANNTPKKLGNFSYEMGVNADHSPPFYDSRAEDHPINGVRHKKIPGSFLKHYVTMLWKKEDFLCNGDDHRVSFDETSRLAFFCTRGYWYGWDDIRYVVQNNGTMYISEMLADIPDYAFKEAKKFDKKPGYLPVVCPVDMTWSPYEPKGSKVDFDLSSATYEKINFTNVEVVGWYLSKTSDSNAQTHCKWYGFECDAVINSPQEASPHIDMKEVTADNKAIPPFYMSTCEVPYGLWQDIYRFGDSPAHVFESRYLYEKSGSMGSMQYGKREHEHDEPVTDLTFYDWLAACNTLSEMEGKTPCYYVDADHTEVFRNRHIATYAYYTEQKGKNEGQRLESGGVYAIRNTQSSTIFLQPIPKIYVKWEATGHRLPTLSEWSAAYHGGQTTADAATAVVQEEQSGGTQPVASKQANKLGLYDMAGNVWELVWNFGDVYDPEKDQPVTALGGDFNFPALPDDSSPTPYGYKPYNGGGSIGIRLVCREAGLAAPQSGAPAETIPTWTFTQSDICGAQHKADPVEEAQLEMVALPGGTFIRHDKKELTVAPLSIGKYSVTYDRWKTVRQWAEAQGYTFSKNGDMGSMYFFDYTHHPDEPVTHLQWFDMVTWCNALSEMEGKEPCYYSDKGCTQVVRQSFAYRPIKMDGWEYIEKKPRFEEYLRGKQTVPWMFTRWDVDGYRLPTAAEFEYAARGGSKDEFPWGADETKWKDYIWGAENAEGRTHKVGMKKPNGFGLHDMQGNIFEWLFSRDAKKGGRPYDRDLDNPIATPYYGYGQPKSKYAPIKGALLVSGPSFLYGKFNMNKTHGVGVQSSPDSGMTHYYSDVGFRVVRCEKDTHPRDGIRPLAEEIIIRYMTIDPKTFNSLK